MMNKKLLEKKDWHFEIYQQNNNIILSVPIPKPAPGFDVIHTLSDYEKEKYLQIGIKALEERIQDMNVNYYDYQMNSWR